MWTTFCYNIDRNGLYVTLIICHTLINVLLSDNIFHAEYIPLDIQKMMTLEYIHFMMSNTHFAVRRNNRHVKFSLKCCSVGIINMSRDMSDDRVKSIHVYIFLFNVLLVSIRRSLVLNNFQIMPDVSISTGNCI